MARQNGFDVLHEIMLDQLPSGNIDGRENRRLDFQSLLPQAEFMRCLFQNNLRQLIGKAVFGCNVENFTRRQRVIAWRFPARHCLEADNRAVFQPHHRHEAHLDGLCGHSLLEVAFNSGTIGPMRPHGGAEHVDAVTTQALGMGHGNFGIAQ